MPGACAASASWCHATIVPLHRHLPSLVSELPVSLTGMPLTNYSRSTIHLLEDTPQCEGRCGSTRCVVPQAECGYSTEDQRSGWFWAGTHLLWLRSEWTSPPLPPLLKSPEWWRPLLLLKLPLPWTSSLPRFLIVDNDFLTGEVPSASSCGLCAVRGGLSAYADSRLRNGVSGGGGCRQHTDQSAGEDAPPRQPRRVSIVRVVNVAFEPAGELAQGVGVMRGFPRAGAGHCCSLIWRKWTRAAEPPLVGS